MNEPLHPISVSGGHGVQVGEGNTQNNYYSVMLAHNVQEGKNIPEAVSKLAAPASSAPGLLWNVPYPPNPFFTGREDVLQQLEQALSSTQKFALTQTQSTNQQVISGLGGIGKTQTAIEYAYRHREQYRAVLWAQADNSTTLDIEFGRIATLLDLPEKNDQDIMVIRNVVKRWLASKEDYLLILDNADIPEILTAFLPPQLGGHLLLTSRARSFGKINLFSPIQLPVLLQEEAIVFLLRRTGRVEAGMPERQWTAELAQELGCLPLALEQAGAYITENQVQLDDYLASFRRRKVDLLEKQGPETGGYDKTVATTWSLNFEAVERQSSIAAEILRLSAFFGPDRIPEELLITSGFASEDAVAVDPLLIAELLAPLTRYSLIQRDSQAHTYDIHRLVQEVIQYRMGEQMRRAYDERAVVILSTAFPWADYSKWNLCARLLPHALVCAKQIATYHMVFFQAANLLNAAGKYMTDRAQYAEAEPLIVAGLTIYEELLQPEALAIANSLNTLGNLYINIGHYETAEPLLVRSLAIYESAAGTEHPSTASLISNLGSLYKSQGRYDQAEALFKRAVAITEKTLGKECYETATSLANLGTLYQAQGHYKQAEPLLVQTLSIYQAILGLQHPVTAISLNNLASLYNSLGRYSQAESLYKQALETSEKVLGSDHPTTCTQLNNLGGFYKSLGRFADAEPLLVRALAVTEKILGAEHPSTAISFNSLAGLYKDLGRYVQAEALYKNSLVIREKTLGLEHPATANCLNNLGILYYTQNLHEQAKPLLTQALAIRGKTLGLEHPETATSLLNIGNLHHRQGDYKQAEHLYKQALAIREKKLGTSHFDTAQVLSSLGLLRIKQGRYSQAELLLGRALTIYEKVLNPQHNLVINTKREYMMLLAKIDMPYKRQKS